MIGGILSLPQEARDMGAPPHWVGNLSVKDLDAAVAAASEQGGTIYKAPFDVPTVGRVAIVADNTGATLALVQFYTEAPGHTEAPAQGEFCWSELMTSDMDRAFSFY
jgi:predicted enzyme related to lactoylglutathione lyase